MNGKELQTKQVGTLNSRLYVLIGVYNLKYLLQSGKIIAESTVNGQPQIDDDPKRLFANTFTQARYPEGRQFLLFLAFDKLQAEMTAVAGYGEASVSIKTLESVVAYGGLVVICVYGFGIRHDVDSELKACRCSICIEEHKDWFK